MPKSEKICVRHPDQSPYPPLFFSFALISTRMRAYIISYLMFHFSQKWNIKLLCLETMQNPSVLIFYSPFRGFSLSSKYSERQIYLRMSTFLPIYVPCLQSKCKLFFILSDNFRFSLHQEYPKTLHLKVFENFFFTYLSAHVSVPIKRDIGTITPISKVVL